MTTKISLLFLAMILIVVSSLTDEGGAVAQLKEVGADDLERVESLWADVPAAPAYAAPAPAAVPPTAAEAAVPLPPQPAPARAESITDAPRID